MNIKIKFNINDDVYTVDYKLTFWEGDFTFKPYVRKTQIKSITVNIRANSLNSNINSEIYYYTTEDSYIPESHIFSNDVDCENYIKSNYQHL